MKINIICCFFCAIIILFPIVNNYIKVIRIKYIIKRIMGCVLCFLEIFLIVYYLRNKIKIGIVNVSCLLFFSFLGASISIITLISKNQGKIDMLYKLIKYPTVAGTLRPMLIEIGWGFVTCIIEEIVWRGMIQDYICERENIIALIITSIFFVISHIKRKLSFCDMIELFILSCVLGVIWILTENILYCILFHWMRNNVTIIITYI